MQLLDPTDVGLLLQVHPRTVVEYFKSGKIPGAFQLGGKLWRIRREDLERYIAARAEEELAKSRGKDVLLIRTLKLDA